MNLDEDSEQPSAGGDLIGLPQPGQPMPVHNAFHYELNSKQERRSMPNRHHNQNQQNDKEQPVLITAESRVPLTIVWGGLMFAVSLTVYVTVWFMTISHKLDAAVTEKQFQVWRDDAANLGLKLPPLPPKPPEAAMMLPFHDQLNPLAKK